MKINARKLKLVIVSIIALYTMVYILSQLKVTHELQGVYKSQEGKEIDVSTRIMGGHGFRNIFKIPKAIVHDRKNFVQQNEHRLTEILKSQTNLDGKNGALEIIGNKLGRYTFPVKNQERSQSKTMSGRAKTYISTKNIKYVVPNIVHYIAFGEKNKWTFNQMLSVKSAYLNIKPEVIYIHCENEPTGSWWTYIKENIETLKLVKVKAPTKIFNQSILVPNHKSDIYRLKVLQNYGGIYLDSNIIALKSFDTFRGYNFTMGIMSNHFKRTPGKLNNDIIISAVNAPFLNLWYNTYQTYKSKERPLDYHSCIIPYRLKTKFPSLIHTEEHSLIFPSNREHLFVYQRNYDLKNKYSIQLIFNPSVQKFDPLTMTSANTTFGYLLRLIYYESKPYLYRQEV